MNTPGERPELLRLAGLSHYAVGDGDVRDLLARYTTEAVDATGATRGFAALAEAESAGLVLVATAGAGWTDEKRLNRLDERHRTGTMTSRVAASGKPLRFDDIVKDLDGYQPFFPNVRSALVVPIALESDERVRGVINLESDRLAAFSPEHEAFVATLADLAALRLAMHDLHAREAALVQMGRELSVAPDPDALMQRVLSITREILRFEDCSLFFLDPGTQRLVLVATQGALTAQVKRATYALGEGLTGWVAAAGKPVRLRDPRTHPKYKGLHREIEEEETGAFIAVPIKAHSGVVGVLRALRRKSTSPWFPNDFTREDQDVLETIASQVGTAVDNAQLLARLVQSERMAAWGEMSAMSSHMIGNRVFAIKGDLNELEHVVGTGTAGETLSHLKRGQVAPLIEGMKRGVFRLEELLAEFRDFVRATALSPVPIDASEITRSVVEETFPKRCGVDLVVQWTDEALPILGDPIKLRRALSELVENAVTFQEATGGVLRVTTRRIGPDEALPYRVPVPRNNPTGWAVLSFEDEGPGVADAEKDKIFRPFYTSRQRGMGLGLAIVKGIIEAHHGGIAEVGTPGVGAHFVVLLPLRAGNPAA
jgi:signal transduction histidine kinase